MAILKCKMCGGDILLSEDKTTGTCDHCGSTMTFPRVSDEQKLNLYNRANHFRRQNEFDKAITAYERILDQDDTDAEAHWGAVLSRYGIEYVEDPVTHERIPTCHRVQISSILSDGDYLAALENAPDTASRDLYEQEARRIAEIQKGILSISSQEKPYDVFICYKETDDSGSRTKDSTLAQEIYYQLTNEGYKVFFSRITLEDKLGQQYEPYIFAALNSAKVMLVIGTKPEYFNAVWVKNEWSRYLTLMKNDRSRLLIPCYRDMDAYDLPDDLGGFQSQDMGKIGFMQDLIRGVKKILESKKAPEVKPSTPQTVSAFGANVENLMKRARLFMEDGDFKSANEYLDRVLDEDAEYAPAYAGKVCTAFGFHKESDLAEATFLYSEHPDWKKALRFATPQQKAVYDAYYEKVKERVTDQIVIWAYDCAVEMAVNPNANQTDLERELNQYKASCTSFVPNRANGELRKGSKENEEVFLRAINNNDPGTIPEKNYIAAAEMFRVIDDDEAASRAENCLALAEQARQKVIYDQAVTRNIHLLSAVELDQLAEQFMTVPDYKDARARAESCHENAEAIRKDLYDTAVKAMNKAGADSWKWKHAQDRLNHTDLNDYRDISALQQKAEQRYQQCVKAETRRKKRNKVLAILAAILAIVAFFVVTKYILSKGHYDKGVSFRNAGQWEEAVSEFEQAGSYSDAATQVKETQYQQAASLNKAGKYGEAYAVYAVIAGYKDVDNIIRTDNNISTAAAAAAREAKLALYKTVGGYVTFGMYPQTSNNKESTAIEWLVLDYDEANDHALLISRYGLDGKQYNDTEEDITWENCTLRAWLNADFYSTAFSAGEQSAILLTSVDNSSQGYNGLNEGNNTQDRVFLLSSAEANKYFDATTGNKDNIKSRIAPTSYVKTNFIFNTTNKTKDGDESWSWWLRSSEAQQSKPLLIGSDGCVYKADITSKLLVRPAFWLDLNADIF